MFFYNVFEKIHKQILNERSDRPLQCNEHQPYIESTVRPHLVERSLLPPRAIFPDHLQSEVRQENASEELLYRHLVGLAMHRLLFGISIWACTFGSIPRNIHTSRLAQLPWTAMGCQAASLQARPCKSLELLTITNATHGRTLLSNHAVASKTSSSGQQWFGRV